MTTQPGFDQNLSRFFHSLDEKLIAILGRGYIQSLITGQGLSKGVLLLTDKRLYQRGKRYNRTPRGGWSSINAHAVVNVDDITGTSYLSQEHPGLLWSAIILGIIVLIFAFTFGEFGEVYFYIPVIASLILFFAYFINRIRLFVVEYAGGSMALNAN